MIFLQKPDVARSSKYLGNFFRTFLNSRKQRNVRSTLFFWEKKGSDILIAGKGEKRGSFFPSLFFYSLKPGGKKITASRFFLISSICGPNFLTKTTIFMFLRIVDQRFKRLKTEKFGRDLALKTQ